MYKEEDRMTRLWMKCWSVVGNWTAGGREKKRGEVAIDVIMRKDQIPCRERCCMVL
jgi:hypothetical protein